MAWSELFDFSTACRREAREQHDRRRLEARRRVREDVRGRRRGVEIARDASSVDARHGWREAMHREDSEQEFKAPHLISSVCSLWLVRAAQLPDLREGNVTCSWVLCCSFAASSSTPDSLTLALRQRAKTAG